jgi:homoserine dehydrogenase
MGKTYPNMCEASKAGAIPLLSTLGECIDNSQVVPFIGIVNEGTLPVGLLAGT